MPRHLRLLLTLAPLALLAGCGDDAANQAATTTPAAATVNVQAPPAPAPQPAATASAPTTSAPAAATSATTPATATQRAAERAAAASLPGPDRRSKSRLKIQSSAAFSASTPQRVVADYAEAWRRRDFAGMARLTQSGPDVQGPATATGIRGWAFARPIAAYRVGATTRGAKTTTVVLTVELNASTQGRPRARLQGPIALHRLGGEWLIDPSYPPVLERVR